MENNSQFRRAFKMPDYSVRGLFGAISFLAVYLKGILAAIVVAIIRIKMNAETG